MHLVCKLVNASDSLLHLNEYCNTVPQHAGQWNKVAHVRTHFVYGAEVIQIN
jgi:hypothetical protein